MRENLVAVISSQPKSESCGAQHFYEPDEEFKTHGCIMVVPPCADCGAPLCRHWRECPRCVKRERNTFAGRLGELRKDHQLEINELKDTFAVDIAKERKLRELLLRNLRTEVAMRAPAMPASYRNGWIAEEQQKAKQKDTYVQRSLVVALAEWPWYYADMMLKAEDAKRNLE